MELLNEVTLQATPAITANGQTSTSETDQKEKESGERLFAGKFKTVEELETSYKNSAKVFNENRELKAQLESLKKVPDDYEIPTDVSLRDIDLQDLKSIAKNAGYTQEQFVKTTKEWESRLQAQIQSLEERKAQIGEANLNILQDYVKTYYPPSLQDTIFTKLIKDENAMNDAFKHREQQLNNQVPGINNSAAGSVKERYEGQKELEKAAREYQSNQTPQNRKRYIEIAREVAHERDDLKKR